MTTELLTSDVCVIFSRRGNSCIATDECVTTDNKTSILWQIMPRKCFKRFRKNHGFCDGPLDDQFNVVINVLFSNRFSSIGFSCEGLRQANCQQIRWQNKKNEINTSWSRVHKNNGQETVPDRARLMKPPWTYPHSEPYQLSAMQVRRPSKRSAKNTIESDDNLDLG